MIKSNITQHIVEFDMSTIGVAVPNLLIFTPNAKHFVIIASAQACHDFLHMVKHK